MDSIRLVKRIYNKAKGVAALSRTLPGFRVPKPAREDYQYNVGNPRSVPVLLL